MHRHACALMFERGWPSIAAAWLLAGCAAPSADSATGREDIYVLRSVREERAPDPSWCAQERTGFAPFGPAFDRFSLWSVEVRTADGKIVNAKTSKAAEGRVCFGPTADPRVLNFYGEGDVGGMSYVGRGECQVQRGDFPGKGITIFRCLLDLRGLPAPYVGGLLTSNTIVSQALIGGDTDPPGYVQSSIATIRLWRAR